MIAPLSLLSGTFYVIDNLAPAFQAVSRANPFFYVISGFRYGFLGAKRHWHSVAGRDGSDRFGCTQRCNRDCCVFRAAVWVEAEELTHLAEVKHQLISIFDVVNTAHCHLVRFDPVQVCNSA